MIVSLNEFFIQFKTIFTIFHTIYVYGKILLF